MANQSGQLKIYSTRQVAEFLSLSIDNLTRHVWKGNISAPEKGPGGNYLWTEQDIQAASWKLNHKLWQPPTAKKKLVGTTK